MRGVTATHFVWRRSLLTGTRGTALALFMHNHTVHEEAQSMRSSISVLLTIVFLSSSLAAQSARAPESATKPIQPSESAAAISAPAPPTSRELKLPAGTSL